MDEIISLMAKNYGIVGFFLLLPVIGCVVLWRENLALRKQNQEDTKAAATAIQTANNATVEAQKQRVEDAQAITGKLVELVSEQASSNKETNLALDRISDVLVALQLGQQAVPSRVHQKG